jgi:hypothetical protein
MPALKALETRLRHALSGRPRQLAWGDAFAMRNALASVRLAFGDRRGMTREQRIAQSVMAFRLQGQNTDFVRLKYACLGLAQPTDWDARRLLEDEKLLQTLLRQVAALRHDKRRFAACRRNLQISLEQATAKETPPSPAMTRNLEMLRAFLRQECHA